MTRFGWGTLCLGSLVFTLALCSRESGAPGQQASMIPISRDYRKLVIPVEGVRASQLVDSWHDPRGGGTRAHEALDIPAPGGTPALAAFSGIVTKIFTSKPGGLTVYIRDGDIQAYYAHLSGYAEGLREGKHVAVGERIAFVGDTGNAGAGNTHLHFAIHEMGPNDRWWQGVPVNPYPLLAGKAPRG